MIITKKGSETNECIIIIQRMFLIINSILEHESARRSNYKHEGFIKITELILLIYISDLS